MATKTPVKSAPQEVGFLSKWQSAVALCDSFKSLVIKTAEDYAAAELKRKQARLYKEQMREEFNSREDVRAVESMRADMIALEKRLDAFNKDVKSGPMARFEEAEAETRRKEEIRLAEIERKKNEAEAQRLAKIAAEEAKKAEAEAARIKKIAEAEAQRLAKIAAEEAKKAAEEIARMKSEGDKKAAAEAKQREEERARAAKEAAYIAAQEAQEAAKAAQERAEAARQEQARLKSAAASAPTPIVVLDPTIKAATRRTVYNYRLTTKRGQFLKDALKDSDRIKPDELSADFPRHLFMLDRVALSEYVNSQGLAAARPGVLEVKEEKV